MLTQRKDHHNGHLNSLQLCKAIYLNVDERKYSLRGNQGNCINILTQCYGKEGNSSPAYLGYFKNKYWCEHSRFLIVASNLDGTFFAPPIKQLSKKI